MEMLSIRKAEKADVEVLTETFASSWGRTHADDIEDQSRGTLSFYVAWLDEQPVGHAFVSWAGARQPKPAAAFPGVPEINRLSVLETFQRRGIAAKLIAQCEQEARDRGIATMGLGTDPDLPRSENLYFRLGYRDSEVGIFDDVYRWVKDGREIREDTQFLIKDV